MSHAIIGKNYNDIKIAGKLDFEKNIRLTTSEKNKEIIPILNKIIDQITNDEKRSILNKYQLIVYQEVKDYSWLYKYVLPLILTMIFTIYVNNKMRKEIKKEKLQKTTYWIMLIKIV